MKFEKVMSLKQFEDQGKRCVFNYGKRQFLLIGVNQDIYALDNRCPQEGHSLADGTLDAKRLLITCNYHNCKFDLKFGKCVLGQDNVRVYKHRVDNGLIWLDVENPPEDEVQKKIMDDLKAAFLERQYSRMARELSRLKYWEVDSISIIKKVMEWSFEKFEHGMGQAYASLPDWLELLGNIKGDPKKEVICLVEAIDHVSHDVLRYPDFPYPDKSIPYSQKDFLLAVEREDAVEACSMILGAWEQGYSFTDLEEVLAMAAVAHFSGCGNSLFLVYKSGRLAEMLSDRLMDKIILLCLTRALVFASREELVPEFKNYPLFLKQFYKIEPPEETIELKLNELIGRKNDKSMEWVVDSSVTSSYSDLIQALCFANARNLFHFDVKNLEWTDIPVMQIIDWHHFVAPILFSEAVRVFCQRYPELRKSALLQLACFYGRNSSFVTGELEEKKWEVINEEEFKRQVWDRLLNHGFCDPASSSLFLQLVTSVFHEVKSPNKPEYKSMLKMALKRFMAFPSRGKHVERTVYRALKLVGKDYEV